MVVMLTCNWGDMYGCTNYFPRMLMMVLWDSTVLLVFYYMFWFFWVWYRALIAGTDYDTLSFLKKSRIAIFIAVSYCFLSEIVRPCSFALIWHLF